MVALPPPTVAHRTLAEALDALRTFEGSPQAFLEALLSVQCQLAGARQAVLLRAVGGAYQPWLTHPQRDLREPMPEWVAAAAARCTALKAPRTTQFLDVAAASGAAVVPFILVPIRHDEQAAWVAVFAVQATDSQELVRRLQRLELTRTLWDLHQARRKANEACSGATTAQLGVEILRDAGPHTRFLPAAMALVNGFASRLSASRVSLGIEQGRYVRLATVSHADGFTRTSELVRGLEAAMEECLDQDVDLRVPATDDRAVVRELARLTAGAERHAAVALPVRGHDRTLGVLVIERNEGPAFGADELAAVRVALDLVTPRLADLHRIDRPLPRKLVDGYAEILRAAISPRRTGLKLALITGCVGVLLALFATGPYRFETPFVLDAAEKHLVAAPFDGFLHQVHVDPGDAVVAGETVLADLDPRELRFEAAALQAELAGFVKEADLARRERKAAELQIAQANAARITAKLKLVEHRLRQATLTSPVAGLVLVGDLRTRLGAPVKRGEVLFEVASPEALCAVLLVPEDRIAEVRPGQHGEAASAAQPDETIRFRVEQVHPVADVVDGRNVFRVRAALLDRPAWLRPGIEGAAKVEAGRARYAWMWTRRCVDWLRLTLWW